MEFDGDSPHTRTQTMKILHVNYIGQRQRSLCVESERQYYIVWCLIIIRIATKVNSDTQNRWLIIQMYTTPALYSAVAMASLLRDYFHHFVAIFVVCHTYSSNSNCINMIE